MGGVSSRKSSSTDTKFVIETVALASVALGTAVLYVTNPTFRQKIAENLKQTGSVFAPSAPPQNFAPSAPRSSSGAPVSGGEGVVYLLKAGPFYKVGKAQDFEKRLRQIKLQLPYQVETVHQIACADISHVEHYWHKRFASKRQNGEWFILTDADVTEFKANKRM